MTISNGTVAVRQREFYQKIKNLKKTVSRIWRRKGGAWLKIAGLALVSALVFFGTQDTSTSNDLPLVRANSEDRYSYTNVDEIAGVELAAEIAKAGNLVISDNLENLADSISTQVQLAGTDTKPYVSKPSLIATDAKTNKDIINYELLLSVTM